MTNEARKNPKRLVLWLALCCVATATVTVLVMMLFANISQRRAEAAQVAFKIVDLHDSTIDPAEWGKNFPRQYDSYRRTVDMARTRYGGSEADPADARQTTSKIAVDPRLVTMWAGYAFAIDFREDRGHAYMLSDQRETKRVTERKQSGACLHCHASSTLAYRKAGIAAGAPGAIDDRLLDTSGLAQLDAGFVKLSAMPYEEATKLVEHPVSCVDCHDPVSLGLRLTRPGFLRGIAALSASNEPVPHLPSIERWRKGDRSKPYDPNAEASRQEMRSMVCGQCHVEYYCGPKATLFFPWNNGMKAEQIEAYYDAYTFPDGSPFSDFTHAVTGAPVYKAQHPELELWSQGIHARSGVACADCHMPYVREGATKVSSHHVRSPLFDVSRSCQTCHRRPEHELLAEVETIQDRTFRLMDRALAALVELIADLEKAKAAGATGERLAKAHVLQRRSQWRVDFINAENSMGFHAPQEAARILGEAIDFARQGQLELRGPSHAARPPAEPEPHVQPAAPEAQPATAPASQPQ